MKKILLSVLILSSCTFMIGKVDNQQKFVLSDNNKDLNIVFSHNINGETHPCGCRHHPLGGLPQVAGNFHEIENKDYLLYLDSGDTFFDANTVPRSMEKSKKYNAKALAKAMVSQKLKYMTLGDYDFAAGEDFLKEILDEAGITLLQTNASKNMKFKYKKLVNLDLGPHRFFIMGVTDPTLLGPNHSRLFTNPEAAISLMLKEIKSMGFDKNNSFHRLILVSHSGMDTDRKLANLFKDEFDWVIGAHSQSFTNTPRTEGKTKLVQVLSRNHYTGRIKMSLKMDKSKDKFFMIENRQEHQKKLKNNPFLSLIDKLKSDLDKIRTKEQNALVTNIVEPKQMLNTANKCIECHSSQGDFWESTPHSLAYTTLISANEAKNLTCVKCHSVGLAQEAGFQTYKDIVRSENKMDYEKYWAAVKEKVVSDKSVRKMSSKEIKVRRVAWKKIDEQFEVDRNFANVQCLNCHSKHQGHPFEDYDDKKPANVKISDMKNKCLSCHDPDQSPEWYDKKTKKVNKKVFSSHFKKLSCPKLD